MTEARMTADGYGFTISVDYDNATDRDLTALRCTQCGWTKRWAEPVALITVFDTAVDHHCEAAA